MVDVEALRGMRTAEVGPDAGEDDAEQMIETLRAVDDGWLRLQTETSEPEVEDGNEPESPDRKAHPVGRLLKNISKKQKTTKKRG